MSWKDKLAERRRKDLGLRGPGDFSPKDPVECPEECPYVLEDGSCPDGDGKGCRWHEEMQARAEDMDYNLREEREWDKKRQ